MEDKEMDREMKRRAWKRLHMEHPYSPTQDRASGGLVHLYASLKRYEDSGIEEALGPYGTRIVRRARIIRRLIERKVIVTRDEALKCMEV